MLGKEGGVCISVCVHVGRKDGLNKNDDEGKLRSTDSARTNKTNAHHRDCLSRQAAVFRIYASSFTLDVAVKRRFGWLAGWLAVTTKRGRVCFDFNGCQKKVHDLLPTFPSLLLVLHLLRAMQAVFIIIILVDRARQ